MLSRLKLSQRPLSERVLLRAAFGLMDQSSRLHVASGGLEARLLDLLEHLGEQEVPWWLVRCDVSRMGVKGARYMRQTLLQAALNGPRPNQRIVRHLLSQVPAQYLAQVLFASMYDNRGRQVAFLDVGSEAVRFVKDVPLYRLMRYAQSDDPACRSTFHWLLSHFIDTVQCTAAMLTTQLVALGGASCCVPLSAQMHWWMYRSKLRAIMKGKMPMQAPMTAQRLLITKPVRSSSERSSCAVDEKHSRMDLELNNL